MTFYPGMVDEDGTMRADLWEARRVARRPVGRCQCGGPLDALPADRPEWSPATYWPAQCRTCRKEQVYVRGTVPTTPPERTDIRDITEPARSPHND